MQLLTAEVVNDRLELSSSRSFTSASDVTYTITATDLRRIEIAGSGSVQISGLSSKSLEASISGSGRIEARGSCGIVAVEISGSGSFNGENLECAIGVAKVSGSGDAVVNASDALDVEISGSGDVRFVGDPVVAENISGSGAAARF